MHHQTRRVETEHSGMLSNTTQMEESFQPKITKVFYTNADGLGNKINELQALSDTHQFDVICITETLPKFTISPSRRDDYTYSLSNYSGYHRVTGRGVSIYVRNTLKSEQLEFNTEFSDNIWVNIESGDNTTTLIGCLYRSPNSNESNNNLLLDILNETKLKKKTRLVIVGDFNLKEIDWANFKVSTRPEHIAMKVFDVINDNFYEQLVKEPTRHREGEQPNVLDWVVTDCSEYIENLNIGPPLGEKGDHNSIQFEMVIPQISHYLPEKLNLYKGDYVSMTTSLNQINWQNELSNKSSNQAWERFHELMALAIKRFIPIFKSKKCTKKSSLWVDKSVREAIANKNKAWNTYKKHKNQLNWKSFTTLRNRANKVVLNAKYNFEHKIANDIKTNPKQFWRYVKSKSHSNRDFPKLVDDDGKVFKTDSEKANLLNNYFVSVFTTENLSSIPTPSFQSESELSEIVINPDVVLKQLNKLNTSKAAGPDEIHSKILYEVRDSIKFPLSIIFQKSIDEGVLPKMWKHAIVKPLFKKGSKTSPKNYRPVSLTSICCKTLERIIRDSIVSHLETNKLLNVNQHGFRSGRSCITQLLELIEIWSDLFDNNLPYDCVYLDFSKAFDKVPHVRLLSKLKAHGIRNKLLEWITNFLQNRTQAVVINNQSSNSLNVTSGIPQGSVLGPILFLMYINDISENISSYIKIFADDTKIFRAITSRSDKDSLQIDLDRLVAWSNKWQLPFNITKCKIIHFGTNNPNFPYSMQNTQVLSDTNEKDLGINFDNKLKFSSHVHLIVAKANSRVGIIRRNFCNLNPEVFLPLYKSLIRPLLEYGSVVWNSISKGDQEEIEKVQRRATKLVRSISHLPYSTRLKHLKLDSLVYRRRRSDVIQVYRILKEIDNIDSASFFTMNQDTRTRGHSLKLSKIRAISSIRSNSFSIRVVNDWNNLKESTISSPTLNSFKTALKQEWADHPDKYFE